MGCGKRDLGSLGGEREQEENKGGLEMSGREISEG